jgi:hypothetical protein
MELKRYEVAVGAYSMAFKRDPVQVHGLTWEMRCFSLTGTGKQAMLLKKRLKLIQRITVDWNGREGSLQKNQPF